IDRMVVGHSKFFTPVQMGHENFLKTTAAVGDVGNPGIKDTGNASKLVDDFVDEFVRDAPKVSHSSSVTLPDSLFVLIHVEQTKFDRNLIALDRKTTLHQAFGADRRPVFEIKCAKSNAACLRI